MALDQLDIPTVEHEVFRNPPLKAMLGRVRFPTVLRIADLPSLAPFQEAIRHEFPTFSQERQLSFVVGPQGPQGASAQQAFRFITEDGGWSILLTPETVTLEADVAVRYASYDEFVERFQLAWTAILTHFGPRQVARQRLRYVDHLESERSAPEWASLINPDLLGPVVERFGDAVTQSASELRLSLADGVLVFKHGMLPVGPDGKMGYLLDFDYSTEQPSDDTSLDAIMQRFNRYHETLHSFFRWCVTDAALEIFRGE
ncbi:MAG TPA: TIGR04255 family protein [Solirubrobacteraceae bacterium]|nr:TIGR04255 family protein [Solirubrobacteraceae bacterium]